MDLNLDEFKVNKDWPNGLNIELHISRKPDAFVLMSSDANTTFKYELKDLELRVKRLQPSPKLLAANNARLLRNPALYSYQKWMSAEYKLEAGQDFFITSTLFNGRIPSKTLYVLMDQKQYLGDFQKNPAHLTHYNLRTFKQKINSIDSPLPLEMEWDGSKNIDIAYRYVMDSLGTDNQPHPFHPLPFLIANTHNKHYHYFSVCFIVGVLSLNTGNFITYEAWAKNRFFPGF